MRPLRAFPAAALAALALLAPVVGAHVGGGAGVETQWEMPAWVVWITGAGVVALSFAIVGAFLTKPLHAGPLVKSAQDDDALPDARPTPGRVIGLVVMLLVVASAFTARYWTAFPDTVVWLLVWSALPLLAYTVGNAWERVNPFRALAPLAERLRGPGAPRAYPRRLGAWPAVALFLALVALEVMGAPPRALALLVGAYALATLAGMTAFGSGPWLAHAEVLTRTFRWWSAAAPLRITPRGVEWRGFTRGLERLRVDGMDDVAFTVAVLYGVNFDGFLATSWGAAVLDALAPAGDLAAHFTVLLAGYAVFLAAFMATARGIASFALSLHSPRVLAARFAASLVPIAVGYHAAHNLFYVLPALTTLTAALADPLGLGWASSSATAWSWPAAWAPAIGTLQMLLIVGGHVVAVVVAHHLAFAGFPSRVQAIRSELPLTGVMVFYTFVGLWIVSRGAHAVTEVGA